MIFKKGNRIAEKPKRCPYCNKLIEVKVYIHSIKKIENGGFKTDKNGI